ncbi:hypothetical protein evm_012152 [Chilo suppressalis]|nr:hypothetical protein evm_012152 [Chilo suppressalis]
MKSQKRRRRDSFSTTSDSSERREWPLLDTEFSDTEMNRNKDDLSEMEYQDEVFSPETSKLEDGPIQNTAPVTLQPSSAPIDEESLDQELTTEILSILGDESVSDERFGPVIHKEIAKRWSEILTNGLKEDIRKDILKSFVIPENMKFAQPPDLNPEIRAAINENIFKRDVILKEKQKLLAGTISGIAYLVSKTITSQDEKQSDDFLKSLCDIGRLLCYMHYSETVTRQNFMLASLNKEVKDNLKDVKRDQLLFGSDLQEKLKLIKAISKTGAEMRPMVSKGKKYIKNRQAEPSTSRSLNWRGPPPPDAYKLDMCDEIKKLLKIGAIQRCSPCDNQFLSSIFLIKKSNGERRFILNLKKLNKNIPTPHFKLEDYRTVMRLLTKNSYMCSIDLKNAYFSVCIHSDSRRYLRFKWLNRLYEFQVLPFGLNIAPYVFTKLMRPVMQYLRNQGFFCIIYLDDLLLLNDTYAGCKRNFEFTKHLLQSLGFTINFEKSNSTPSQTATYLGFVFNSVDYTISLTEEKRQKIKLELLHYRNLKKCKLRNFAHLIGLLISSCPAIQFSWLYTKSFESVKYLALKQNDDYDQYINLPSDLEKDFDWWLNHIDKAVSPIRTGDYKLEIFTDASGSGWGASCVGGTACGQWSSQELKEHINTLELRAAFFGLKIFAKNLSNCEILLRIDNSTAIAYINRMGGIRFPHLTAISRDIWQWCEQRELYIFASYISSTDNHVADAESRRVHSDIEWELANDAYRLICEIFEEPKIDLFASRLNKKCSTFVSWHRDPEAFAVDAFTLSWTEYYFYAFPPFCLIIKVLQKIITDKARGIIVVPRWPSQPWYPLFKKLLVSQILELKPNSKLLSSPYSAQHKLHRTLSLEVGIVSGQHS